MEIIFSRRLSSLAGWPARWKIALNPPPPRPPLTTLSARSTLLFDSRPTTITYLYDATALNETGVLHFHRRNIRPLEHYLERCTYLEVITL